VLLDGLAAFVSPPAFEADVGPQSTETIKLNFMGMIVPTGLGSKPLATLRF
jgi:hypothetical protein